MNIEQQATQKENRGADCLSDMALDELVINENQPERSAHVASCRRCSARLHLFTQARADDAVTVNRLLARAREKRAQPWWKISPQRFSLALAGIAAVVVVIMVKANPSLPPDDLRIKGEASLRFVVQREGAVFNGLSGQRYRAGDALRFVVSQPRGGYFFLVGVEDSGKVSAYYPFAGRRSVELAATSEMPLPGSLVLDDSAHTEYFLGVFSERPLEIETIEQAIAAERAQRALSPAAKLILPAKIQWIEIRRGGA